MSFTTFRQSVTGYHRAAGSRSNGHWVEGASTSFTFLASIQPAGKNDMESLPEGRSNSKAYRLYTDTKLVALAVGQSPDLVSLFSETYEVVSEFPWRNNVINHYKYIVSKVGNP